MNDEFQQRDFNPRTREGCDVLLPLYNFNLGFYFNPRTREGCDEALGRGHDLTKIISIHAPVKGATRVLRVSGQSNLISIHAPVKGATPFPWFGGDDTRAISIHAPVKGATDKDT